LIWIAALAYHAALIWGAYRFGENNAGRGVAIFVAGVVAFQLVTLGPSSFIEGGCDATAPRALDC